jgi:hypothetical protein
MSGFTNEFATVGGWVTTLVGFSFFRIVVTNSPE